MRPTKTLSPVHPRIDDCECTPSVQHLFLRHYLLQRPMFFIRWIYAALYSLYLLFVLRAPTDRDIVDFIENTTMAMLIRPATDDKSGEYKLTVNDCKLRASGGYKLKNMSLGYKKGKSGAYILYFTRNGVEVDDRSQIFSTIYFYHTHSMHTKSHLFSNSLVRHIVDNDIKTLKESSYTSIALHNELLHSSLSVFQFEGNVSKYLGYGVAGIRESLVEESRNMSVLEGHQVMHRSNPHEKDSFVGKLYRSRLALQGAMKRHEIDPKLLDALFNHTIVHSVDHVSNSEWSFLRFSLHPWAEDCNIYQAFNTSMFRILIVQPNVNPLAPNTIRSIKKPFYQDLYRDLKKIDSHWADVVTASVMY
ncbi:Hypp1061 [Branchiostoma lanceolatum]|nr:Hypp1061 [Branchiostoma lanceolatum]